MNEIVTINSTDLTIKEYGGQRVVTLKEVDAVHQRPEGTARRNFNTNRSHLIEGTDYFTLTQPDEIRSLGFERPQGGLPEKVTLITESGYLILVKSFTDDLAWEVQRQLVNTYFRVQQATRKLPKLHTDAAVSAKRVQVMELNARTRVASQMLRLWSDAGVKPEYQALAMQGYYPGLSLPREALSGQATALLDATTIAKNLRILSKNEAPHARAVTAIIKKLGKLSADEYAMTPYSKNGHDGTAIQYTAGVERKIERWLEVNGYPVMISDGVKNYAVRYGGGKKISA